LAIVYEIVQAHEGKVFARSKLGQGSVFVLRLRRFAVGETLTGPQAVPAPAQSRALETINAAAAMGGGARG